VNFSSSNAGVTFTAEAPGAQGAGNSSATSLIPTGPVTVNTLSAVGTDFAAGNISAIVMGDITTGFGGSFSGGLANGNIAEAYSGVVRVTNTTGSQSSYSFQDTNTWALSVVGTESAAIALAAQLQRWDVFLAESKELDVNPVIQGSYCLNIRIVVERPTAGLARRQRSISLTDSDDAR